MLFQVGACVKGPIGALVGSWNSVAGPAALVATPLIISLFFPICRRLNVTSVYE